MTSSSSSSITTTLENISRKVPQLAAAANVDFDLLSPLKSYNISNKRNDLFKLIKQSVYDNYSGLNSYKLSFNLFKYLSLKSN